MADENFRANMAAAARNVFGDIPIEFTPTGIRFPGPMGAFGDPRKVRLGQERVQMLLKNEVEGDAFLAKGATDMLSRSIRANLLRCRADKLMKEKQFSQAARLYLESAETYCGAKIPVRHARSKVYMDLDKNWDAQDAMSCFAGAAKALMQMKDYSQALLWLGESQTVYNNIRYDMIRDDPAFDWFDFHLQTSHHYIQVFTMYNTLADAYIKLGNTGASVYYRFQAQVAMSNVPPTVKTSEMDRLLDNAGKELRATSCYRHPEPSLVAKLEVIDKKSHVHGSWAKIELKSPGGLTSRMGCGVFAHESYCYVVGGEKFTGGPYYRDFWRLDLSKMDKWESLPTCPIPESRVDSLAGYKMAVGPDDKAYYFTGSPDVVYFDLKASRWEYLRTTFKPDVALKKSWPYPSQRLQDFVMQCVGDRLYVFGGRHDDAELGCDLLLELNLSTAQWRRLSGSVLPEKASFLSPGPRINACSWVGKDKNKIFVMYGDANRMGAQLARQAHGASGLTSYGYDDLWSWDIPGAKWTREKIVGNAPSPRTEMAAVYNPILDKVVTFGGYSPSAPTFHRQNNELFHYSYYADTFICDFNNPRPSSVDPQERASSSCSRASAVDSIPASWRQVLTRGFPTYRARAHLIVDPATGKTYLFSGYINTEYVPSRLKQFSRSFCDLWELRMDIPGGHFDGVDLEEEARTAKAGPWQRCFACGSAGPWKKCGGACRGRVFFCSPQCLKDGWREHKQNHNCRKLT